MTAAIGLSLGAVAAKADVYYPYNGKIDALLFVGGMYNSASYKITFDESAFTDIHAVIFYNYTNFYDLSAVCGGTPGQFPCWYSEPLDLAISFDINKSGPIDPFSYKYDANPPIYIAAQDDGFIATYYSQNDCYVWQGEPRCSRVDGFRGFSIYGTPKGEGPVEITIERYPVTPMAVPEPATWAMMIAGFGLVGAALRRRRLALAWVENRLTR